MKRKIEYDTQTVFEHDVDTVRLWHLEIVKDRNPCEILGLWKLLSGEL